jgi:hypothetical protein
VLLAIKVSKESLMKTEKTIRAKVLELRKRQRRRGLYIDNPYFFPWTLNLG